MQSAATNLKMDDLDTKRRRRDRSKLRRAFKETLNEKTKTPSQTHDEELLLVQRNVKRLKKSHDRLVNTRVHALEVLKKKVVSDNKRSAPKHSSKSKKKGKQDQEELGEDDLDDDDLGDLAGL